MAGYRPQEIILYTLSKDPAQSTNKTVQSQTNNEVSKGTETILPCHGQHRNNGTERDRLVYKKERGGAVYLLLFY